jgi:hypothetical protein
MSDFRLVNVLPFLPPNVLHRLGFKSATAIIFFFAGKLMEWRWKRFEVTVKKMVEGLKVDLMILTRALPDFARYTFYPRELAKLRGYTSCFVVVVVAVVVVVVACLLVFYSLKQFDNLTLQQGSQARMQFCILPLQQGNSLRVHEVWYPATASGSLVSFHCKWQFGILLLQQGNNRRVHAVWYPATSSGSLVSFHCKWKFGILPLQVAVWYPATARGSLVSCHCKWQFGILPLQQGNSRRVHAVWYPATASDCRALVCSLRNCHCSGAKLSGRRPVALLAELQHGGRNFRP